MTTIHSYLRTLGKPVLELFCAQLKQFSCAYAYYEKDNHPFETLLFQQDGKDTSSRSAGEGCGNVKARRAFGLGVCARASSAHEWSFDYHPLMQASCASSTYEQDLAVLTSEMFVPQAFFWQPFDVKEEPRVLVPRYMLWEHAGTSYVAINSTQELCEDEVECKLETLYSISEQSLSWEPKKTHQDLSNASAKTLENIIKTQGKDEFCALVERAQECIKLGTHKKIVCARKVSVDFDEPFEEASLVRELISRETPGTLILVKDEGVVWYALSPELLADQQEEHICTMALAGTYRNTSLCYEGDLREPDSKTLEEHALVIEDIRAKIAPLIEEQSLTQNPEPLKMDLGILSHACTPLKAQLTHSLRNNANSNLVFEEICKALHPTAALGGYPSKAAIEFLLAEEGFNRGLFGGYCALLGCTVGEKKASAAQRASVMLRCFCTEGTSVRFFAGCGIVKDSVPLDEFEENVAKIWSIARLIAKNHLEECDADEL